MDLIIYILAGASIGAFLVYLIFKAELNKVKNERDITLDELKSTKENSDKKDADIRVAQEKLNILKQSFDDAKRLARLGARNIKVNGNIKFLNIAQATEKYTKAYPLVVTAASTHEGEEEGILEAFLALKEVEAAQLIVVPRHPERFKKVEEMLQRAANKHDLSFSSFSQNQHLDTDIVLIDTMGELVNMYKISDIVVLGGAFAPIGGHNALEAAQFGVKLISGSEYFNQVDIFKAVEGIEICTLEDLTDTLLNYRALEDTKVDIKASIDELLEDIKSVL